MLDCLILGDSIAVGVGQARPACETIAKTGITSGSFVQTLRAAAPKAARSVVISLGVNDDATVNTVDNLRTLRRGLQAAQVTWLLPGLKDNVRGFIRSVALEHGDRLVDTRGQAGPDHLHPTGQGYRLIAATLEQQTPYPPGQPFSIASHQAPTNQASTSAGLGSTGLLRMQSPGGTAGWRVMAGPGSLYGAWPPARTAYAALPPPDYAYRSFASSPLRWQQR